MLSRRLLIAAAAGLAAFPAAAAQARAPVVTILGDSITAGLGLAAGDALPAQLQAALAAIGVAATVRGAGVSGDTTAGGLARLDFSVQPDTRVCVIELGANDYLQSVEPKVMQANLTAIVRRLKTRGIAVVLAGNNAPRTGSGAYGRAFDAVFPSVAHAGDAILAPDLLAGVEDRPGFRQADGLHPNAAGVKIIAARLAPAVARALRSRK
ncbi:MAG TPA: GDSL-type esterase/lipase family protein [Caulobacteraceae bacterium]